MRQGFQYGPLPGLEFGCGEQNGLEFTEAFGLLLHAHIGTHLHADVCKYYVHMLHTNTNYSHCTKSLGIIKTFTFTGIMHFADFHSMFVFHGPFQISSPPEDYARPWAHKGPLCAPLTAMTSPTTCRAEMILANCFFSRKTPSCHELPIHAPASSPTCK